MAWHCYSAKPSADTLMIKLGSDSCIHIWDKYFDDQIPKSSNETTGNTGLQCLYSFYLVGYHVYTKYYLLGNIFSLC